MKGIISVNLDCCGQVVFVTWKRQIVVTEVGKSGLRRHSFDALKLQEPPLQVVMHAEISLLCGVGQAYRMTCVCHVLFDSERDSKCQNNLDRNEREVLACRHQQEIQIHVCAQLCSKQS